MASLILNQKTIDAGHPPGMVLLEFIRDVRCLSGTKEACREGECGACTVLVGARHADGSTQYKAVASCLLPVGDVEGSHVVTVEGLEGNSQLTLIQELIIEKNASQCGFCTPGIVLSLTGFCLTSDDFAYEDAIDALDGNLCRCTGYVAIREAARALCDRLAGLDRDPARRVATLVAAGVLPGYFAGIPGRLAALPPSPKAPEDAILVAGGTDLFVQKPEELRDRPLRFLSRRRDLDYVRVEDGLLHVGGAVTLEDFRCAAAVKEHLPALEKDLLLHSSTILRNKATLTGNIVNASPIGDMTIILLALDATLIIEKAEGGGRRAVQLDHFFHGYKKFDLAPGETIVEIAIPLLSPTAAYAFEKVSNRVTLDIAAVNAAIRVATAPDGALADLRIAAGGVAAVPLAIAGLERFHGRVADAATCAEIAGFVAESVTPIDDIRGSAAYKKKLLRQLTRALLERTAGKEARS